MKKIYFGSNLKMYKNTSDTQEYITKLVELTKKISREKMELFILPSYTSLFSASNLNTQNFIRLGAQNVSWADEGQLTGEISVPMLKELQIDLVMLGHSERRHIFGEKDQDLNNKIKNALKHKLTVLLCVGETLEEKKYNLTREVLTKQLKIDLYEISSDHIQQLIIAYEPVWSIGVNGIPATPEYAEESHKMIRKILKEIFGEKGNIIPILYGGSVNRKNARRLVLKPSIDGLFVGRAAWDAENFSALIEESLDILESKHAKLSSSN